MVVDVRGAAGTVNAVARLRYEASQDTLRTQVSIAEAKELMDVRGRPLGGRDAITHFLYRVMITLMEREKSNHDLRRQVERLREPKQRMGTPTTLSPLDAVKFAAPEQLAAIMGHINSTQLNALQQAVADAQARAGALAADLTAVRGATQSLLSRGDLPADARVAFIQLLNSLPEDPGPVPVPRALEMAQLVGMVEPRPVVVPPGQGNPATIGRAPAELPDADPFDQLSPTASGPESRTTSPAGDLDGVRLEALSALPQYGPAPAWVPGPGPSIGS